MTRPLAALALFVVLIAGTGLTTLALGFSGTAAALAAILVAAVLWAPALLALEHVALYRERDHG